MTHKKEGEKYTSHVNTDIGEPHFIIYLFFGTHRATLAVLKVRVLYLFLADHYLSKLVKVAI